MPKVCKIKGSVFAAKPSEKFGAAAATDLVTRIESINDSAQLW